MSDEVYIFEVTVPKGTAITSPIIVPCSMPARVVRQIDIKVPPGPGGNVGLQIAVNGVQQFPVNTGAWLRTDDEEIHWTINSPITSGAWQVIAYNTGVYAHVIEVRFQVDLPPSMTQTVLRAPLAL